MKKTPKKATSEPAKKAPKRTWKRPSVQSGAAAERNALGPSNPCGGGVDEESGCGFGP